MSPGLSSPHRLLFGAARPQNPNSAPLGASVFVCSRGSPTAPVFFLHLGFNKHRQHPNKADPRRSNPAAEAGTKLFPLLSSSLLSSARSSLLPNPRLYQLSIKKIQLQFGIRQNTLITKARCNLITWYLFGALSEAFTPIQRRGGGGGGRKHQMLETLVLSGTYLMNGLCA